MQLSVARDRTPSSRNQDRSQGSRTSRTCYKGFPPNSITSSRDRTRQPRRRSRRSLRPSPLCPPPSRSALPRPGAPKSWKGQGLPMLRNSLCAPAPTRPGWPSDTGYVLKESLLDSSFSRSKVTIQGPGGGDAKSLQGYLDFSQLASKHSVTFATLGGNGENPRLAREMTFSNEGVRVQGIESMGRAPSYLHFSPERSVTMERDLGLGQENPQCMGQLQADGTIAFDGTLGYLGVPKTLAIEFPLPLDLTSKMDPGQPT